MKLTTAQTTALTFAAKPGYSIQDHAHNYKKTSWQPTNAQGGHNKGNRIAAKTLTILAGLGLIDLGRGYEFGPLVYNITDAGRAAVEAL